MRSLASLSVLVPIYNERATIERLLNEVVAVKTGLTVEVLVVRRRLDRRHARDPVEARRCPA